MRLFVLSDVAAQAQRLLDSGLGRRLTQGRLRSFEGLFVDLDRGAFGHVCIPCCRAVPRAWRAMNQRKLNSS